jgi:hypothetical protein
MTSLSSSVGAGAGAASSAASSGLGTSESAGFHAPASSTTLDLPSRPTTSSSTAIQRLVELDRVIESKLQALLRSWPSPGTGPSSASPASVLIATRIASGDSTSPLSPSTTTEVDLEAFNPAPGFIVARSSQQQATGLPSRVRPALNEFAGATAAAPTFAASDRPGDSVATVGRSESRESKTKPMKVGKTSNFDS